MSLQIIRIINSPIPSNCYIIYDNEFGNKCLIIDPGSYNNEKLDSKLQEFKIVPEYVILTHEHFDHIWGVNELRNKYNFSLIASTSCSVAVTERKKNLSIFYNQVGFELLPAEIIIEDLDNKLYLYNNEISFINTPGHTTGSICIVLKNMLFSGDLLIKDQKTVTKLPGGNLSIANESINMIKEIMPSDTIVYPGHGEYFILSQYSSNIKFTEKYEHTVFSTHH